MNKLLFFAILIATLAATIPAAAAPFIVCHPQAGVEYYEIAGLDASIVVSPAVADGSIHHDLDGLSPGSYAIEVTACSELRGCSDPAPFGFSRPALSTPSDIKLRK